MPLISFACGAPSQTRQEPESAAGPTADFELAVVPGIDEDNPQVGRASWKYDRARYAPTDAPPHGPLASQTHVDAHRSGASISGFNQGECAHFDAETRATCPLLSVVEKVEKTADGVRLVIRKTVDLRAALDHMRCHHSFGRAHNYREMASCPLYVHGAEIVTVPGSHAIEIRSPSAAAVREIQERAQTHQAK